MQESEQEGPKTILFVKDEEKSIKRIQIPLETNFGLTVLQLLH